MGFEQEAAGLVVGVGAVSGRKQRAGVDDEHSVASKALGQQLVCLGGSPGGTRRPDRREGEVAPPCGLLVWSSFEVRRDRLDRHLLGAHVSRLGHLGHPAGEILGEVDGQRQTDKRRSRASSSCHYRSAFRLAAGCSLVAPLPVALDRPTCRPVERGRAGCGGRGRSELAAQPGDGSLQVGDASESCSEVAFEVAASGGGIVLCSNRSRLGDLCPLGGVSEHRLELTEASDPPAGAWRARFTRSGNPHVHAGRTHLSSMALLALEHEGERQDCQPTSERPRSRAPHRLDRERPTGPGAARRDEDQVQEPADSSIAISRFARWSIEGLG